jgi:hypothetical protein
MLTTPKEYHRKTANTSGKIDEDVLEAEEEAPFGSFLCRKAGRNSSGLFGLAFPGRANLRGFVIVIVVVDVVPEEGAEGSTAAGCPSGSLLALARCCWCIVDPRERMVRKGMVVVSPPSLSLSLLSPLACDWSGLLYCNRT